MSACQCYTTLPRRRENGEFDGLYGEYSGQARFRWTDGSLSLLPTPAALCQGLRITRERFRWALSKSGVSFPLTPSLRQGNAGKRIGISLSPAHGNIRLKGLNALKLYIALAAIALAGGPTAVLAAQTPKQKPNILFVFADQWRAAATGYAGDPNVRTPHLDRLARQSVNVTHAISGCPVCTPYRASFLTGQRPLTHGLFLNDVPLREDAPTLAKALKMPATIQPTSASGISMAMAAPTSSAASAARASITGKYSNAPMTTPTRCSTPTHRKNSDGTAMTPGADP